MPSAAHKKRLLRRALRALEKMYGPVPPRPFRPGAPLDVLVRAMLSQNTNMLNASRGYKMLRRRFPSWPAVMRAPLADVQREIAICGLARMRARRLQDLLRLLKAERGKLTLDFLAGEGPQEAFDYLMNFHGIGPKTAAYTLLFGFAHPVLPVDNGILRVVRRLRLVRPAARDLEAERVLSPLIAKGKHLPTHVLLFRHAKERCRPRNPKCHDCKLLSMCPHGQRVMRHRPHEWDEPPSRPRRLANFISAGILRQTEKD